MDIIGILIGIIGILIGIAGVAWGIWADSKSNKKTDEMKGLLKQVLENQGVGPDSVQPELDSEGHKIPNHYVLKAETGRYKITGNQAKIVRKVVGQIHTQLPGVKQSAKGKVATPDENESD